MKNKIISLLKKFHLLKIAEIICYTIFLPITFIKILRNYFFPGTIVLIYHRIFTPGIDSQLLCVTPENFEKQLLYLKKNYKILKIDKLIKYLKEKRTFRKGIIITFDDGYADNYEFAFPILERLKIPVTIFVCTDNIDKDEEMWSHQLEQIFYLNKNLPTKLSFTFNGKKYVFNTQNNRPIKNTYNELHELIKSQNKKKRDEIIAILFNWSGVTKTTKKYYRSLSSSELNKMSNSKYIEIGSHTISHHCLSKLSYDEQKEEIEESKKQLEKILNKKIFAFSYPFGRKRDYNFETLKIVKNNYQIAFSNFPGVVRGKSNIYELPRFLVRNWDINIFRKKIKEFFLKY